MNYQPLLFASATALFALGTPLSAHAADCRAPKGLGEEGACAAAAQGVETLRRYVNRTRMIYQLRIHDFAKAVPPSQLVKEDEKTRLAQAQTK
jgi:hypothetical protein